MAAFLAASFNLLFSFLDNSGKLSLSYCCSPSEFVVASTGCCLSSSSCYSIYSSASELVALD